MAKTGVFDSDPAVVTKATELKRELEKLMRSIVEDEDSGIEKIDRAQEMLSVLKELKVVRKRRSSQPLSFKMLETVSCPEEFRCPLSKQMMKDPVILASGQTYDRPFIQKWLTSGNRTCPKTQQVLSHTNLIPNNLIREMILKWCKSQGIELPNHVHHINEEEGVTRSEREHFNFLLNKMSAATLPEQKSAAKELRLLTKRAPQFRALFGESPDAIHRLLRPLINGGHPDDDLREDVVTTLLNISIHDCNKKLVCEIPEVIPLLMEALRCGTIETRSNAAAAIFTLSALDSNKVLIGESGVLKPLIDLLEEGHPLAMKDVASAIFNLCIVHENRARAVGDGAVRVIVRNIMDGLHVDELLAILAMLSSHQKAVEDMGELGAVSCLLGIIRESDCERNKENAIAILHVIFFSDRTKWKEIREEENMHGTVSKLAQDGTSRAKRKANAILERMRRAVNLTHTA